MLAPNNVSTSPSCADCSTRTNAPERILSMALKTDRPTRDVPEGRRSLKNDCVDATPAKPTADCEATDASAGNEDSRFMRSRRIGGVRAGSQKGLQLICVTCPPGTHECRDEDQGTKTTAAHASQSVAIWEVRPNLRVRANQ